MAYHLHLTRVFSSSRVRALFSRFYPKLSSTSSITVENMFYSAELLTRRGVFTLAWCVIKLWGVPSPAIRCLLSLTLFSMSLFFIAFHALHRLAGTISGISALKSYLDRMIRMHGRANILSIWYVFSHASLSLQSHLFPLLWGFYRFTLCNARPVLFLLSFPWF